MRHEIRFKVNEAQRKQAADQEEWDKELAKRIEQIIEGSGKVFPKDSGYKWQLGTTNDWWMDRDPETDEFIVAYRYANPTNYHYLDALKETIIFLLGLAVFNDKNEKAVA